MTGSADGFEVVRYRRNDRDRVFAFLGEALAPAAGAHLMRQWEWKYDANPFTADGQPHILLLQERGRVVGMYGRLFLRIAIDGVVHVAHHGCDLLVHPAYRGRGLSARLRDADALESAIHFSWQNEASYRVARRDGTAGVPFVSLIRPLDVARVVQRLLGEHWLGRGLGRAAQRMASLRRRPVSLPGVLVTPIRSFDERFDDLWQRVCRDYPVMIVRDRRYLEWRFAQRPDTSYRMYAARSGSEVLGYMVTRCADRADGGRWGYLVDFVVRDKSPLVFAALLQRALEDLREDGAVAVSCRVAVPPYIRFLRRHGFMRLPRGARGYIRARTRLPHAAKDVGDVRRWFLTMGDGDLEMSF